MKLTAAGGLVSRCGRNLGRTLQKLYIIYICLIPWEIENLIMCRMFLTDLTPLIDERPLSFFDERAAPSPDIVAASPGSSRPALLGQLLRWPQLDGGHAWHGCSRPAERG